MSRPAIFLAGCALCVMACGCEPEAPRATPQRQYVIGANGGRAAIVRVRDCEYVITWNEAYSYKSAIGITHAADCPNPAHSLSFRLRPADTIRHNVVRYAR